MTTSAANAFEVYETTGARDQAGNPRKEWRWRVTADNSQIVAASSEGFHDRVGCFNNARRTWRYLNAAMIAGKLGA